jgi:signal transduction histidine kinase
MAADSTAGADGTGDLRPGGPDLGSRLARWWRRRGLRARLTLTATAGLAVALACGALLGVHAFAASLITALDGTARQSAKGVAALVNDNRMPDPVPVAGGTVTVQVLSPGDRIIAASPGADRLVPLLSGADLASAADTGRAILLDGGPYGLPGLLRVVAVPASGGRIVIAAVSFTQVNGSIKKLWTAALIGTPALVLFLAAVNWLVIGGALRPVTELRKGAQEISTAVGSRRLPVPQTRDEVHSLAVTLNDMLTRLESAQARQRALVSDTAHELRSPIASIRAQLEVAIDHPDRQDWPQTARDVLADTLRLAKLAEDLLVLARLDERAGQLTLSAPADLGALACAATARYEGARVPVGYTASGTVLTRGDPDGLTRVLVNLIDNAVRYAASTVTVAAWRDREDALVSVTDDGPGIPPADAQRVFGRFTRLDDARSREDEYEGGAGLGLAIVRATVLAHGGSVWLEDAGPGLRAVVRIPAAAPAAGTSAAAREHASGMTRETGGPQAHAGQPARTP